MRFERETVVILFLIAIVLFPMWFFALSSGGAKAAVVLSNDKGVIAPNETFLPTPVEVNEFIAGVITWVALFVLVGMIFYTHQFVRTIGRSSESAIADGGVANRLPSYLTTENRWVADYWPAQYSNPGMVGLALMAWSVVVFALLFGTEALGYARTQFLGIYGGMLFLSLGVLVAIYATWFMPNVLVVEERGHHGKISEEETER
ncbi:hypothetical protein V5735_07400 (plasmid) [Haladaptatus sp. SPP-AMP-3]|uniref:hypothetical protein n=1 Tax=Haladaptatus sp. SPP-AMP-3 TaxID=3121295 RepID=UPI003C2E291B